MKMTTDLDLLREYAHGSEKAFAALVARHLNLVYSAALRQVKSSQLAEDIAQSVFTDLAQNVHRLKPETVLAAWLYQITHRTALNVSRGEARRQAREQIAVELADMNATSSDWTQIEPWLDEAMETLEEPDRAAILLRYFENKSLRDVGETLGVGEDAAQKRVSRAVERLREFFSKRNVTVGASGLVVLISANAVQAAPIGLAVTISTVAALAGTLTATTLATKTTLMTMNWINTKSIAAMVASAFVAGTGTYLVEQREANRLRSENQSFAAAQRKLIDERDATLSASRANNDVLERAGREKNELLRLRGEVGTLRAQAKEFEKLREQNRELQAALAKANQAAPPPEIDPEADPQRQVAIAKMNDAKLIVLGLIMYADDNQGRLPAEFNHASKYWGDAAHQLTNANQFELVVHGSLTSITNPSTVIAVREKDSTLVNGIRIKAYGFVDGHSEIKREPPEGFEAWEKQHMIRQPGQ